MNIRASHNRVGLGQAVGVSLSVADLSRFSAFEKQWDRLVETTRGIDRWCTRLPWQRSVDTAFGHRFTDDDTAFGDTFGDTDLSEPVLETESKDDVVDIEEGWAYAFRARSMNDGTEVLLPLDSVWAFASPIVLDQHGDRPNLSISAAEIAGSIFANRTWRVAFLTGMEAESAMFTALAREFAGVARVVAGESTVRCVASLHDGVEGYLSRRPRTFRRNLRSATRQADCAGVSFDVADTRLPGETIERLQDVERRSWKGLAGSGIVAPDMARLYALLVDELHAARGLRATFAQRNGKDIGFILGGVLGSTYRGLQLSFVEDERPLSVGNLLQLHEIKRLSDADIETYDLGMDMEYKRLWSDSLMTTTPLIVIRP